jgi:hypothetical protein
MLDSFSCFLTAFVTSPDALFIICRPMPTAHSDETWPLDEQTTNAVGAFDILAGGDGPAYGPVSSPDSLFNANLQSPVTPPTGLEFGGFPDLYFSGRPDHVRRPSFLPSASVFCFCFLDFACHGTISPCFLETQNAVQPVVILELRKQSL